MEETNTMGIASASQDMERLTMRMRHGQEVVYGQGRILYDERSRAWALPGGARTYDRAVAQSWAEYIDRVHRDAAAASRGYSTR
jgi:hypothetical protein